MFQLSDMIALVLIYKLAVSHGQQNVIMTFKVRGQGIGANALKSAYLTRYWFKGLMSIHTSIYSPVTNKICPKVKFTMPMLLFSYLTNGHRVLRF